MALEKLKQSMLERIERNAIKIDISGKKIYLKKSGMFKEWRVIYPPVNPETKKWDWVNFIFGGKSNAFRTFIVGVIILLLIFGISQIINSYESIMSNPTVQMCLRGAGIELN